VPLNLTQGKDQQQVPYTEQGQLASYEGLHFMELVSTSKLLVESYITADSDTTQYGNHQSLAMRLYYTQVDITYEDIQL